MEEKGGEGEGGRGREEGKARRRRENAEHLGHEKVQLDAQLRFRLARPRDGHKVEGVLSVQCASHARTKGGRHKATCGVEGYWNGGKLPVGQ